MELRSYSLKKNARWTFALKVETQYSLCMVPRTEVCGIHLLRAVSGNDMCKFSIMTLRRMALPPAFHLLLPLQKGKHGHELFKPGRREHCSINGPQESGCLGDGYLHSHPSPSNVILGPYNSSHTSMLIDTVHW